MYPIKFITGNINKFQEAQHVLGEQIEQVDIDLPEIQDLDAKEIIKVKLQEALKDVDGPLMVEDQSFYIDALGGLPGPLIKWFLKAIGPQGIAEIAQKCENQKATVTTIFGYALNQEDIFFFENSVSGIVVLPRGQGGFGWDPIFLPDGWNETFGEWKEKNSGPNTMRLEALKKLQRFLEEQKTS